MSIRSRVDVERDGEQLELIGTGNVPATGLTREEELVILAREGARRDED